MNEPYPKISDVQKTLGDYKLLPTWVRWLPLAVILMAGVTVGALIDAKNLRAKLSSASVQPYAMGMPFARGKINYADARAMYDQLRQPLEETGVFNKRSMQERQAYVQAARVLRDKVEPIFGVSSECFSAASMRAEYANNLHTFASALEGIGKLNDWQDLTHPMRSAFMYGNAVAGCNSDVEALQ